MENIRFLELTPVVKHEKLWRVLRQATDNRISFVELRKIEEHVSPDIQYRFLIYEDREAFLEGITLKSIPNKDRAKLLYGRVMPGMILPTVHIKSRIFLEETAAVEITRYSMKGRRELHIYLPDHSEGVKRVETHSAH